VGDLDAEAVKGQLSWKAVTLLAAFAIHEEVEQMS
jgi:hypothetical protein